MLEGFLDDAYLGLVLEEGCFRRNPCYDLGSMPTMAAITCVVNLLGGMVVELCILELSSCHVSQGENPRSGFLDRATTTALVLFSLLKVSL